MDSSRAMAACRTFELELPVDVRQIDTVQEPSLRLDFAVQRRAGHGRIEHELVEDGFVRHRVIDHRIDVRRGVVFEADDARPVDAYPV